MIPAGVLSSAHVPATGGSFAPSDLANLAMWYDASDASTITSSGGLVSQWNDKSGNGRHLTQATDARKPLTGVLTQNGLNLVSYDNTRRHLGSSYTIPNSTWTWFYVWQLADQADFIVGATSSPLRYKGAATSGSGTAHSAQWAGDIYVNGSVIGSTRGAVHSAMNNATTVARWTGAVSAGGENLFTGYPDVTFNNTGGQGEIIAYSAALSTGDIATVEAYLMDKWAI